MNLWDGTGVNFFSDSQVVAAAVFFGGFLLNFVFMYRRLHQLEAELDRAKWKHDHDLQYWKDQCAYAERQLEQARRGLVVRDLDEDPDDVPESEPAPGSLALMVSKPRKKR